jgi:hypothetical protein
MMRNALALTLLAAFAFGLLAGPHPCSARHDEGKVRHAATCHGMMKAEHGDAAGASVSVRGATNCCETFCLHACHMTAVANAEPLSFVISPVARSVIQVPDAGLAPFAQAIDHIPLA